MPKGTEALNLRAFDEGSAAFENDYGSNRTAKKEEEAAPVST